LYVNVMHIMHIMSGPVRSCFICSFVVARGDVHAFRYCINKTNEQPNLYACTHTRGELETKIYCLSNGRTNPPNLAVRERVSTRLKILTNSHSIFNPWASPAFRFKIDDRTLT